MKRNFYKGNKGLLLSSVETQRRGREDNKDCVIVITVTVVTPTVTVCQDCLPLARGGGGNF